MLSACYNDLQIHIHTAMSLSAIRTGRYTHSKKAADIIEVKTLEGSMKTMESEEQHMAIIKALEDGVKESQMVPLISTHYSHLTNYQDNKLQVCEFAAKFYPISDVEQLHY